MALMVSISGVRGIVGDGGLTPEVVLRYVSAFAAIQLPTHSSTSGKLEEDNLTKSGDAAATIVSKPTLIIGRDSRVSGPWVRHLIHGTAMALGYSVLDLGIVATPTVQYICLVRKAEGVIITSSHNPIEWNGLKFVDRDGCFLAPARCAEMFALADSGPSKKTPLYPGYLNMGLVQELPTAEHEHIAAVLNCPFVKSNTVAMQQFVVCLDTVNGAGGVIMSRLLKELGCKVIGMNLDQTGIFAHSPEPIPANLSDLCKAVVAHKADLGIAVDPDVDRCVLIDEQGRPLGEEYTLGLAVQLVLGEFGKRGPVCKNLSSSRVVDDIAKKYGCEVYATPVGEIHVAKKMLEVNAVIGGEGNGGVMLPDIHVGRDAPVAAALILQLFTIFREKGGKTISELKATLPQYQIVKLSCPVVGIDMDAMFAHFKKEYATVKGASMNESDGLRIDVEAEKEGESGKWVHLRKSNTEPIVRVIGEAVNAEEATAFCHKFMDVIKASKN